MRSMPNKQHFKTASIDDLFSSFSELFEGTSEVEAMLIFQYKDNTSLMCRTHFVETDRALKSIKEAVGMRTAASVLCPSTTRLLNSNTDELKVAIGADEHRWGEFVLNSLPCVRLDVDSQIRFYYDDTARDAAKKELCDGDILRRCQEAMAIVPIPQRPRSMAQPFDNWRRLARVFVDWFFIYLFIYLFNGPNSACDPVVIIIPTVGTLELGIVVYITLACMMYRARTLMPLYCGFFKTFCSSLDSSGCFSLPPMKSRFVGTATKLRYCTTVSSSLPFQTLHRSTMESAFVSAQYQSRLTFLLAVIPATLVTAVATSTRTAIACTFSCLNYSSSLVVRERMIFC
jgi:hypothetical protein